MKKTPNYIKKTLDDAKIELLKDNKLQLSRQLYIQKLKEIFSKKTLDLNENLQTKMSYAGSGQSSVTTTVNIDNNNDLIKKSKEINNKIIFLNNEIIENQFSDVEEANNELQNLNDNVIELKDEIEVSKNQKIIELIEEVDDVINLTDEVVNEVASNSDNHNNEILLKEEVSKEIDRKPSQYSNEQLEILNAKINDLDLNSSELTEKLDELLNQKNIFSDKFNDELDIKLSEALNRSEDNLESKLSGINDSYHQEFSKYEEETNKNFANLEDQIGQLNIQFSNIQNNLTNISTKIEDSIQKINETKSLDETSSIEQRFDNKISELQDYNLKIENSLNNLNNKIDETLDKISVYKNDVNQRLTEMEPELINKIEEKQRNKTESEKLQDKFDQMSKIMDMQNMRMLQMYHSSELQHSHSILQKNIEKKSSSSKKDVDPELIADEFKKEVFPKIQKEMDKQFDLLREQLSEYEIKSVLDKINSTDLNKEFKKPTKKFSNLFDAKKYVKNSISRKSRDWIKNNDLAIDEIAKKLLDK